jgi:hypothetical protein
LRCAVGASAAGSALVTLLAVANVVLSGITNGVADTTHASITVVVVVSARLGSGVEGGVEGRR